MKFSGNRVYGLVVLLALATPAAAQVCKENSAGSSGKANLVCDHRYRDTLVACDKKFANDVVGTLPSCPPYPMPMIDTPKKSYIKDYSPRLFAYPRDPKDKARPYAGDYSIGTVGDAIKTFQMFGKSSRGARPAAACSVLLKAPENLSLEDEAKFNRLQLDACTNQYILSWALGPFQKEIPSRLSIERPGEKVSLETQCQPLKTFEGEDNEYSASAYLEAAWKKTLHDPAHRKTTPDTLRDVPCIGGVPCDREPHLPSGTQLESKVAPPNPFPEVLLSGIDSVKYEEINDPTHPFSPRWDFLINDREYSNPSIQSLANIEKLKRAVKIYGYHNIYMTDVKDTIFCAGLKNADKEQDEQKKKEKTVPVDVLEFRRPWFEDGLEGRTQYNSVCFMHRDKIGEQAVWIVAPASFCFNITKITPTYPWVWARGKDCWQCYGYNTGEKVDGDKKPPPCTTNYLGKDLKMKKVLPGGLNRFSISAQCGPGMKRDDKYLMDKMCADLRRPVTMLNKLKMRYHNTEDKDDKEGKNNALTEGALEGLTFKEYFGHHMPYPRLWDTGSSLQKTPNADRNNQPPMDITGQYTAIVGVGREAAAKTASDAAPADEDGKKPADKYIDQRCKIMGWGKPSGAAANLPLQFAGVRLQVPDPVTSWTEMKLYQTRSQRIEGMSCLGRYEKIFKPGSAENMMMMATGADWSRLVISKCKREKGGKLKDCEHLSFDDYVKAGSPQGDDTTAYSFQTTNKAVVNSWRGYLASSIEGGKHTFPKFGGGSPSTVTGLDQAKLGDMILMPHGPKDDSSKPGLAKIALVIEVNTPTSNPRCVAEKSCYVKVFEPDDGKFPDICGVTDTWGEMKTRTYFKPGMLPEKAKEEYKRINADTPPGDCEETRLNRCEMSAWDKLKLYRIAKDRRVACDKPRAIDCKAP